MDNCKDQTTLDNNTYQETATKNESPSKPSKEKAVTDETEAEVGAAPDGGWGWVVCISCFMTHVLTDGIFYSFGVLFVELLAYFGHGKGETAWISSLATGMCFLSGPFSAVLTNQLGCRRVAIIGSFILSGSFIISSFAPNIYFLYFSFGILAGTGYGLIYLPSIVCVSMYFQKRRALATGIGVSGSGIGTFIFGPIANIFLHEYGWRGAVLLFGGICLNCLVCAFSFLPLPKSEQSKQKTQLDDVVKSAEFTKTQDGEDNSAKYYSEPVCDSINETSVMLDDLTAVDDGAKLKQVTNCEGRDISAELELRLVSSKDVSMTSHRSLNNIRADESEGVPKSEAFMDELWESIKVSLDPEMFKNIPFVLFLISTVLYSFGYYVPYIYLPDTAKVAGLNDEQGAWLVATVGITNTAGRILFGALSDRKWVNRLLLYSCALVACGIATSLGPLFTSYASLLFYAVIFGLSSGVTISLTSVIIADIVGIQKLAGAFGVINFFAGIAIMLGPPFVGWLFDVSGSYYLTYMVAGLTIAVSGAMLFATPCLRKAKH